MTKTWKALWILAGIVSLAACREQYQPNRSGLDAEVDTIDRSAKHEISALDRLTTNPLNQLASNTCGPVQVTAQNGMRYSRPGNGNEVVSGLAVHVLATSQTVYYDDATTNTFGAENQQSAMTQCGDRLSISINGELIEIGRVVDDPFEFDPDLTQVEMAPGFSAAIYVRNAESSEFVEFIVPAAGELAPQYEQQDLRIVITKDRV